MQLDKRVGRVFAGVVYTWSKDLTTATGDTSFVRPDQYTHQAYYGLSGNDRRHNLAFNYVYDLPRMAGQNKAVKAALGGWHAPAPSTKASAMANGRTERPNRADLRPACVLAFP